MLLRSPAGRLLASFQALLALVATVIVLALAPGCSADDDEEAVSLSSDELVNCAGDNVVYRVASSARLWDKPSGEALANNHSTGTLMQGARVVRTNQTVDATVGGMWLYVKPVDASATAKAGWVEARLLELVTPAAGTCRDGRDPSQNLSAVERDNVSRDRQGPVWVDATMQCIVNLGQGVVAEGADLVDGMRALIKSLPAIGKAAGSMMVGMLERQRDTILAMLGNEAAIASVRNQAIEDARRLRAALASIAHAITVIREYLEKEYLYFQQLDAPHKTGYVCKLVGRVAFEVVLQLATSGTIAAVRAGTEASGLTASVLEKLAGANKAFARFADIPERVGEAGLVYTRQEAYAESFVSKLEALRVAPDTTSKKQLLRWFSGEGNPLFDLDRVGEGNCAYAAISTIFSIGSGHPTCPLAYVSDELTAKLGVPSDGSLEAILDELEKVSRVERRAKPYVVDPDFVPMADLKATLGQLGEGRLALLASTSEIGGHATVVTRLDGVLTVINNQGWDNHAGASLLLDVDAWDALWRTQLQTENVGYSAIITDFYLPK
ncbi:hypothetical protein AKJ09_10768 [Labilithrix luteola]|uniref:Uncharacterized protein n=1 Tax=Labilithrix luteola TaxID=1391654 RepID=A0A0K1QF92_9BACT|nr:hypothetical protein [Labilithrix luteola]AKV04105.1 hypothetical protein AKJ09_10768 [Labilithrix luteola]